MEGENQEKCIRQCVLSVARNVKFRSNLTEADPYTAENAMQREDPQEEIDIDTKLTSWLPILRSQSFFFLIFSSSARTVKRHFRARNFLKIAILIFRFWDTFNYGLRGTDGKSDGKVVGQKLAFSDSCNSIARFACSHYQRMLVSWNTINRVSLVWFAPFFFVAWAFLKLRIIEWWGSRIFILVTVGTVLLTLLLILVFRIWKYWTAHEVKLPNKKVRAPCNRSVGALQQTIHGIA